MKNKQNLYANRLIINPLNLLMTLGIVIELHGMFDLNDYLIPFFSQYSKITTIEQRRQYKKDFEKDFLEYKTLFENRKRITKLFTDLEVQLRQVSNNEERHKVSQVIHCASSFAC